ncbi:DEAD/DEAH box helicase [Aureibacter tunicatorum]|uniref:ATP-dependent RNA helicase RhlE n=1 Tax=Aureibacter tunicatorum TaxID=866807 RepID=A0AAE3XLI4_9BACT|nr:DEAD/DEAH box helicase [Aureibacter tunicatorum]MDR6237154.1 ATP-dependent RNA helicase RhlE [Aureibacter tunicatorum]BDD06146.1 DEAD/DEAH box helicase [Aureibacter tunicatorum]
MSKNIQTFEDFKLNKQILNAIKDLEYTEPTEIQKLAIPLVQAGHDLFGIAQTGTGKTAAFVLPLLMKIKYAQGNDPRALIFAPTRELVMQIADNIEKLSKYTDIRQVTLYGGVGPKTQIENIQKGADIIVATPGRFMDIYKRGDINTRQLKTLVLDEADKMMDMGFMPQIRQLLEIIPRKRQNLLFSATMPEKVLTLSEEFLEFPEKVEVAPQATTVDTIDQRVYKVPNFKTKINLLFHLLEDEERFNRVIIFVNTRSVAENIFKFLERKANGKIKAIHANKGQNSRINAMEAFKNGEVRILVTTDVAARGIDVSKVSHVINFNTPPIYEDYVHRVGRTGRAKNEGEAISFINPLEEYHFKKIEDLIQKEIPVKEIPNSVAIEKTPFAEQQEILRALDDIKKKEDPTFKGAFHEKKRKPNTSDKKGVKSKNSIKDRKTRGKNTAYSSSKNRKKRR